MYCQHVKHIPRGEGSPRGKTRRSGLFSALAEAVHGAFGFRADGEEIVGCAVESVVLLMRLRAVRRMVSTEGTVLLVMEAGPAGAEGTTPFFSAEIGMSLVPEGRTFSAGGEGAFFAMFPVALKALRVGTESRLAEGPAFRAEGVLPSAVFLAAVRAPAPGFCGAFPAALEAVPLFARVFLTPAVGGVAALAPEFLIVTAGPEALSVGNKKYTFKYRLGSPLGHCLVYYGYIVDKQLL